MKTRIKLKHIAAIAAILLALVLFVFTAAACGDEVEPPSGTAIEGWSDDWGADDWGDGYKPPSSDPNDYNKIDWTEKYGAYTEGGINATQGSEYVPFYPGNGAHIYQAERAELSGSANTTEGGTYVGSLDNSSVTFRFESEVAGTALVVAAFATNPIMPSGLPFNQQFSMYSNGERIDTSDCWLKGTGGWTTFAENAVGEITLVKGGNTVEFFSGLSRTNLDYIKIVPTLADAEAYPPAPEKYEQTFDINERIEAENTDFTNAQIETNTTSTGVALSWTSFDTTIEFIVRNSLDVDVTRTLRMFAATGEGDDVSGELSPLFGKDKMTTFERVYIDDKKWHHEQKNSYYKLCQQKQWCEKLLRDFGIEGEHCHIINGHVPVKEIDGENPIKAEGKLLVIDGGFCKAYHKTTGIAGYTLIYNSHGLELAAHEPFTGIANAIKNCTDIHSRVRVFERISNRMTVAETDNGKEIYSRIDDLKELVAKYRMYECQI